jgi:MATE family multidrug resistance protein
VPVAADLLGRRAGMGAVGGWLGFVAETICATVLFGLRWRRGAWRHVFVGPRRRDDSSAAASLTA